MTEDKKAAPGRPGGHGHPLDGGLAHPDPGELGEQGAGRGERVGLGRQERAPLPAGGGGISRVQAQGGIQRRETGAAGGAVEVRAGEGAPPRGASSGPARG